MDSNISNNNIKRRNLRLSTELCDAVDNACLKRTGKVSFNTWILEAIQEKLVREKISLPKKGGHRA